MKYKFKPIKQFLAVITLLLAFSSCEEFLDRQPLDQVTPDSYFRTEADLEAYSIASYSFPSHGTGWGVGEIVGGDHHTDNAATTEPSYQYWAKGEWRTSENDGNYSFNQIYNANYFFHKVLPLWQSGEISGNENNIDHYIGEMYVVRAWVYFSKLKTFGDFPIVEEILPDTKEALIEASKRRPRNEVARFILEDLDKAIPLLNDEMGGNRRVTKKTAQLIKSRVALYEASWLTYHKGTAHVPGGNGWPGATAEYNKDFKINIDAEIDFFLTEAMEAADDVASVVELTPNSGVFEPLNGDAHSGWNPYFEMFALNDMSRNKEILMWREYSTNLNLMHSVTTYIKDGGNTGITKSLIDSYLMSDGLPIYASNDYKGDVTIQDVKDGRDHRLQLFIFDEKSRRLMDTHTQPTSETSNLFNSPRIIENTLNRDVTGYRQRKFYSYDPAQTPLGTGLSNDYGSISFRGVEAYLNYIEACYMKNGSLDSKAVSYWRAIRNRAGVDPDFQKTIVATDLTKENDWAVYSAGKLVDPTLYNIRRERRCEFISENMRWDDLKRWRSLDQVKDYVIEGFNLWDEAYDSDQYKTVESDGTVKSRLVRPEDAIILNETPNVSSDNNSKYLRPYQIIQEQNLVFNGYNWSKANYLSPLPIYQIKMTSVNSDDPSTSPLYQNPYWPTESHMGAIE